MRVNAQNFLINMLVQKRNVLTNVQKIINLNMNIKIIAMKIVLKELS